MIRYSYRLQPYFQDISDSNYCSLYSQDESCYKLGYDCSQCYNITQPVMNQVKDKLHFVELF